VPELMNSFVKEKNNEEQREIDKKIRKFERMIEAGGIDEAMGEINRGFKEAAKRERKRVYMQ